MRWNLTLKTAAVAVVGMFVAASVHSVSANPQQNEIAIGTGGLTGIYYPAGGAICEKVNKTSRSYGPRCFTESTAGSIYNLGALHKGEIGDLQSSSQTGSITGFQWSEGLAETNAEVIVLVHC